MSGWIQATTQQNTILEWAKNSKHTCAKILELPPPREDTESPVSDDFDFDIPDSMNFEQNGNEDSAEPNRDMEMSVEQKKNIITPPSMPADVSKVHNFLWKPQKFHKLLSIAHARKWEDEIE